MDIVTLIVSLATLGGAISGITAALSAWLERKKGGRGETIEDRVNNLTRSLKEATQLISNIESEIKARSALASQLQQDLDRYNQLVEMKKPEVEAIAQLLRGELKMEARATFWKGFLLNFLFFVLGAGASLLIETLIR